MSFISIPFFPTHQEFLYAKFPFRNFRPRACRALPGMEYLKCSADMFDVFMDIKSIRAESGEGFLREQNFRPTPAPLKR